MPRGESVPELFKMNRSLWVLGGAKQGNHFAKSEDKSMLALVLRIM